MPFSLEGTNGYLCSLNSKTTEEKHIHWDIRVAPSNHKGNSKAQQNKLNA